MLKLLSVFIILTLSVGSSCAESYEGDGAWAVVNYSKHVVLVLSVGSYRENPIKGAIPTFMLNPDNGSCLLSFGLSIRKDELPSQLSRETTDAKRVLKNIIRQSEFLADDKVLEGRFKDVQALDLGSIIYARTLIDSDALIAFMDSTTGTIRIKGRDMSIIFDMFGFDETMNNLIDKYCK